MRPVDGFRAGNLSRRELLRRAAWTGAGLAVGYAWRPGVARAATVAPAGVHLQYGADPAQAMAVSWRTPPGAGHPRVRVGPATMGPQVELVPQTRQVVDPDPALGASLSYPVSEYQHAVVSGLRPETAYVYEVSHDGANPMRGVFQTARTGRHPLRFTAFGDQGTGTASDLESTPYGAYVVDQVERVQPQFHLHLGDLAYSNLHRGTDRGPAWDRFIDNNSRSAAQRPWMPALGNHEIDGGTGPQGYGAYLTRFELPSNGSAKYAGRWYAFTAGSVRVIVTDANDVCYQDAGIDMYIRGYSGGAQLVWLEQELRAARQSRAVDWVVCVVHQLICSSSLGGNGCDLGVRKAFRPLFDRYGVDLVLSGHDHDYERTFALRGTEPGSATDTPSVASRALSEIDTTKGTVYMVLGGGGAAPTGPYGMDPSTGQPQARVIVTPKGSASATEPAAWSAMRDPNWPFGFAAFEVDPGATPGGQTRINVTSYRTASGAGGQPTVLERFSLLRPRSDRPLAAHRHHRPPHHRHKRRRKHHGHHAR
jgi:hypothetical protein